MERLFFSSPSVGKRGEGSFPVPAGHCLESPPRWGAVAEGWDAKISRLRAVLQLEEKCASMAGPNLEFAGNSSNGRQKGGPSRLLEAIIATDNLYQAWKKVRNGSPLAGSDRVTPEMFGCRVKENLVRLQQQMEEGSYRPQPFLQFPGPSSPGRPPRPLQIPAVVDRLLATAALTQLAPIANRVFSDSSHGYRSGRSHRSAREVASILVRSGKSWVCHADIRDFFDSVGHARLAELLERFWEDDQVRILLMSWMRTPSWKGAALVPRQNGLP